MPLLMLSTFLPSLPARIQSFEHRLECVLLGVVTSTMAQDMAVNANASIRSVSSIAKRKKNEKRNGPRSLHMQTNSSATVRE